MAFKHFVMKQLLNPPLRLDKEIMRLLDANKSMSSAEMHAQISNVTINAVSEAIQTNLKPRKLVEIDRKAWVRGITYMVTYWRLTPTGKQLLEDERNEHATNP
ncbi:hypothetical protein [Methylophilus sp. DW102]|uniref:hypothetical protein n=1 Tax=Methylophilus sp. DW102 TaxID=3095607 RepID=UPI0030852B04|nr:hypothetical protein MTDW_12950 [Methylophilus sp. DW102]